MSDDIGADSTLEREIAPILSIGDAFPKILITRTRHEPHTREGVLVLNFARWLLGGISRDRARRAVCARTGNAVAMRAACRVRLAFC